MFDGLAGAEASEMASKLLLDYFLLHSMFISINPNTEGYIMVNEGQNKEARQEQHDVSLLRCGSSYAFILFLVQKEIWWGMTLANSPLCSYI